MEDIMWDEVLDLTVKLAVPTLLAIGFILVKKGCQIISDKLDVEISAKEWEIIDRIVEESVRAVEEDSRVNMLSSFEKEELALAKIKQSQKLDDKFNDSKLRNKIRACVNRLYNHNRDN